MLTALFVIAVGTLVAVAIGWLFLSGLLRMTFHRARTALRRLTERRHEARPDVDRRARERRH